MADDILAGVDALLEGVTEGPWEWCDETGYLVTADGEMVPSFNEANARFLAAARTLVPKLRDEVARLRERQESHDLANEAIRQEGRAIDAEAEVRRLNDLVAEFRKRDEVATRVIEGQRAEVEHYRREAEVWRAKRDLANCDVAELRSEVERFRGVLNRPLETSDAEHAAFRRAADPVEAFNLFVRRWVPEQWHGHLLDDDENDGEHMRRLLRGDQ